MAQRIIKEYGERAITRETSASHLAEALDIPEQKACQIIASLELGRRYFAKTAGRPLYVRNEKNAFSYWRDMGALKKEQLRGLYLGSHHQVVHEEVISIGTLTSNLVHAREVFTPAIEHSAVAIILAHNHPSGSLTPTPDDYETTLQLVKSGKILGIDIIDHLIIAGDRYVSMASFIQDHS